MIPYTIDDEIIDLERWINLTTMDFVEKDLPPTEI
jgi:hypothetical protein